MVTLHFPSPIEFAYIIRLTLVSTTAIEISTMCYYMIHISIKVNLCSIDLHISNPLIFKKVKSLLQHVIISLTIWSVMSAKYSKFKG